MKTYTYDARDRVTSKAFQRDDNTTKTTSYELTPAGSVAKITVDGQVSTSFSYPAA